MGSKDWWIFYEAFGKQTEVRYLTEVGTESPEQALSLSSEGGPNFMSRALSEIQTRSLGVQDFLYRPPDAAAYVNYRRRESGNANTQLNKAPFDGISKELFKALHIPRCFFFWYSLLNFIIILFSDSSFFFEFHAICTLSTADFVYRSRSESEIGLFNSLRFLQLVILLSCCTASLSRNQFKTSISSNTALSLYLLIYSAIII